MLAVWGEAVDFLADVDQITNIETLQHNLRDNISHYGLDSYVCSGSLRYDKTLEYEVMADDLPDGFLDEFESRCVTNNPSTQLLVSSTKPFLWSDLPQRLGSDASGLEETAEVARSFGMANGICVPIHHPGGYVGAVGIAGPAKEISKEAAIILQMMAIHFHDRARELSSKREKRCSKPPDKRAKNGRDACALSPRERECVGWVAEGKTDWDIGEILGISQSTAHFHIENAKKKLQVPTRVQLVVKAISRGYITV